MKTLWKAAAMAAALTNPVYAQELPPLPGFTRPLFDSGDSPLKTCLDKIADTYAPQAFMTPSLNYYARLRMEMVKEFNQDLTEARAHGMSKNEALAHYDKDENSRFKAQVENCIRTHW
ncbi:MAG: hypothetical protein GDA53_02880 [Rhodobacteraceae bacterium]|nr:hypothetical protein [Paracoccaceae bacterium]